MLRKRPLLFSRFYFRADLATNHKRKVLGVLRDVALFIISDEQTKINQVSLFWLDCSRGIDIYKIFLYLRLFSVEEVNLFLHIRLGFLPFPPVLENLILHLLGVR